MANDVWSRLDAGVTAAIAALELDGLPTVASQVFPDCSGLADAALPLCSVIQVLAPLKIGHTSASIERRYPVTVCLVDPAEDVHTKKAGYLDLLETIAGTFEALKFRAVMAVAEAKFCDVDWAAAFDPSLPTYRHVKSSVTLWFRCHVPLGT